MAKTDVTPDTQRAKYQARGNQPTIGDEIDEAHSRGRAEGRASRRGGSGPTKVYAKGRTYTETDQAGSGAPGGAPVAFRTPSGGPVPGVTAPMVVELLIVTTSSIVDNHRPPIPSEFLSIFAVFGILGAAQRTSAARAAQWFAWGLVLATFYNSAVPGQTPGGIRALQSIGDFMSGKWGKGPTAPGTTTTTAKPAPAATKK